MQKRGINFRQLEAATKLSKSAIDKWKCNDSRTDKIAVVADYFNVSVDYLLGRTDFEMPDYLLSETNEVARKLIDFTEQLTLSPIQAKIIIARMKRLYDFNQGEK